MLFWSVKQSVRVESELQNRSASSRVKLIGRLSLSYLIISLTPANDFNITSTTSTMNHEPRILREN